MASVISYEINKGTSGFQNLNIKIYAISLKGQSDSSTVTTQTLYYVGSSSNFVQKTFSNNKITETLNSDLSTVGSFDPAYLTSNNQKYVSFILEIKDTVSRVTYINTVTSKIDYYTGVLTKSTTQTTHNPEVV